LIYFIKVLRNYEVIAQLPENCFDLVLQIEKKFLAGELPCVTKAPTITQSFFKFLNGKSPEESYELLRVVRDEQKTSTELNYIPTGKVVYNFLFIAFFFVLFGHYI
jgi:hypothetical protein